MEEKEYEKMKEEIRQCKIKMIKASKKLVHEKSFMTADEFARRASHLLWIVNRLEMPGGDGEEVKNEFTELLSEAMAMKVIADLFIHEAEEEEKNAASQTS